MSQKFDVRSQWHKDAEAEPVNPNTALKASIRTKSESIIQIILDNRKHSYPKRYISSTINARKH